jgi:hypothetical protein
MPLRLVAALMLVPWVCTSCAGRGGGGGGAAGVAPGGWYKGNLHTHSLWSDGDDFPEHIAAWYRDRGYHFLAISDHNTAQDSEKWVRYKDLYAKGAGPAADGYLKAFAKTARTRGDRAAGTQEIRLTPFAEYKSRFDRPGRFLLVQGEEISDTFEKKPIHINATNVGKTIKPQGGGSVVEVIRNNLKAIRAQSTELGRPILPHLNHPNFQWGVTAEELAAVVEEPFFEVYNGHPAVNQEGDEHPPAGTTRPVRPSIERLWDIANAIRMVTFKAPPLMGLGTDDTHNYHAGGMSRATAGRGWVMVRAKELTPEALIAAMEAGEFYASSGVTLRDVRYDAGTGTLRLDVQPDGDAKFTTRFVGTRKAAAQGGGSNAAVDPAHVHVTFATVEGATPTYRLTGDELYVRAVVTSDRPAENPSLAGQKKQAWTQPVGWERYVAGARPGKD